MKRSILITALLGLFFLPAFPQPDSQLKLKNKSEGISVYQDRNPFYQAKAFDFSSLLNDSVFNKKLFIPKIPDKKLFFGRIPFSEPKTFHSNHKIENMPILKPEGIFDHMEIYRANPRYKYTLLIKD